MSYTSSHLVEVRDCNDEQKGVFAKTDIPKDEFIGCFDGKAIVVDLDHKEELDAFWWHQSIHVRRDGDKLLCLLPQWDPEGIDFVNHSCRPTARVEGLLCVYADRDIKADEQITVDYRKLNLVAEGIPCWCADAQCEI